MPKKSTIVTAKHNSCCPLCLGLILKGEKISVYNNAWYHPTCCEQVVIAMKARKRLQGVK